MDGLTARMRLRFQRARKLVSLGASTGQGAKLALLSNWFLLQRWLGARQGPAASVRIRGAHGVVGLTVTSAADISVLEEIFIRGDYDVGLVRRPRLIVDLGSNFGASVAYFQSKFPDARILAFEPAATTFAQLVANTKDLPTVQCFNEAISAATGRAMLHSVPARSAGASLKNRSPDARGESVRTVTLDDIFHREGLDWIDLVKFDVEGSELELFEASRNRARIGELIGEYHTDLVGRELGDFLSLFPDFHCVELAVHDQRCLVHLVNPALRNS